MYLNSCSSWLRFFHSTNSSRLFQTITFWQETGSRDFPAYLHVSTWREYRFTHAKYSVSTLL